MLVLLEPQTVHCQGSNCKILICKRAQAVFSACLIWSEPPVNEPALYKEARSNTYVFYSMYMLCLKTQACISRKQVGRQAMHI